MATIVRSAVDVSGVAPWDAVARHIREWTTAEGVSLRDAVVLVPFVQLLAPARRAFAAAGGWMPRVETTRTLAATLGPPPRRGSGELGWGVAHDTLLAMQQLAGQRWAADWSRRDPRGFAQSAARAVATAHQLMAAAAAVAPGDRADWWAEARVLLQPPAGPGGTERLLALVAFEWAAASRRRLTDRLFALRPSAWIAVRAGGPDPLAAALLDKAHGARPAGIDTDVDPAAPFRDLPAGSAPAFFICDGFEDEAAAAAAQVLVHVERGETPVALIAQDRVLVRRVRALLERSAVVLRDETGWKLVDHARRRGRDGAAARGASRCQRRRLARLAEVGADRRPPAAARWRRSKRRCASARSPTRAAWRARTRCGRSRRLRDDAGSGRRRARRESPRRSLVDWLDALRRRARSHGRAGAPARRCRRPAGARRARHRACCSTTERRAQLAADLEPMTLADFTRWVDDVLERETYLPPDPVDDAGRSRCRPTS